MILLFEQLLNGLQYGAMLFMLASGLTLIFGIMGVINLTHGSFYMLGAYCAAFAILSTGSFLAGVAAALVGAGSTPCWSRSASCNGSTDATTFIRCWRPSGSSCSRTRQ
jgi:branched-chain amino acid transport system permease protein